MQVRTASSLLIALAMTLSCVSSSTPGSPARQVDRPGLIQLVDPSRHCEKKVAPRPRKTPLPPYPPELRKERISGIVYVSAIITVDGTLRDVQVIQSDHPKLSAATIPVISQWRYEPCLCDGVPVEVRLTTTSRFTLR